MAEDAQDELAQWMIGHVGHVPPAFKVGRVDRNATACRAGVDDSVGTYIGEGQGDRRATVDDGVLAAEDDLTRSAGLGHTRVIVDAAVREFGNRQIMFFAL